MLKHYSNQTHLIVGSNEKEELNDDVTDKRWLVNDLLLFSVSRRSEVFLGFSEVKRVFSSLFQVFFSVIFIAFSLFLPTVSNLAWFARRFLKTGIKSFISYIKPRFFAITLSKYVLELANSVDLVLDQWIPKEHNLDDCFIFLWCVLFLRVVAFERGGFLTLWGEAGLSPPLVHVRRGEGSRLRRKKTMLLLVLVTVTASLMVGNDVPGRPRLNLLRMYSLLLSVGSLMFRIFLFASLLIVEHGSFKKYMWNFVNNKGPTQSQFRYGRQVPVKSKDIVRRGFRSVSPTFIYSFMQAVGLTNDHLMGCFRYQDCCVVD